MLSGPRMKLGSATDPFCLSVPSRCRKFALSAFTTSMILLIASRTVSVRLSIAFGCRFAASGPTESVVKIRLSAGYEFVGSVRSELDGPGIAVIGTCGSDSGMAQTAVRMMS